MSIERQIPQGTKAYCTGCNRLVGVQPCGADHRYWTLAPHHERKNGFRCSGVGSFAPNKMPTLCDECNGKGGTIHGVCIHCRGQGCIVPTANHELPPDAPEWRAR